MKIAKYDQIQRNSEHSVKGTLLPIQMHIAQIKNMTQDPFA